MTASHRVRVAVSGRVQGVGFRQFVLRTARRLTLGGWVANSPDGTVQVEAIGTASNVDALLNELWRGPPGARVDSVQELPSQHGEALSEAFEIRASIPG